MNFKRENEERRQIGQGKGSGPIKVELGMQKYNSISNFNDVA